MKVLAFTPQYLPIVGGIEILVDGLAKALREHSVETVVMTDRPGELPEYEVVNETPVHRLDFCGPINTREPDKLLNAFGQLMALVEAERPDVIHMHAAMQGSTWHTHRLYRKLELRPPLIVTQHTPMDSGQRVSLARDVLLMADALTAVSREALRSAINFSGRAGFSALIQNGIEKLDSLAGGACPVTPPHRLICVGRLVHAKGYDVAIKALAQVRKRGLDAELTIVGGGEARRNLEEVAAAHGVSDYVYFQGMLHHANARKAMAASSVLLVPSRIPEGFSLVVAEAALEGIPCVASRKGALFETVKHGISGLLVRPDDPGALASAVIALLRDEAQRRRLGENARRLAEETFGMDRCAQRYRMLYCACRDGTLEHCRL